MRGNRVSIRSWLCVVVLAGMVVGLPVGLRAADSGNSGQPVVPSSPGGAESPGLFALRVIQANGIYYDLDYTERLLNNFSYEPVEDRHGTDSGTLFGVQIRSKLDFTFPLSLHLFAEYAPDIWSTTTADLWRYNDGLRLTQHDGEEDLETRNRRIGVYFELGTSIPVAQILEQPLLLQLRLGFGYRNWERRFIADEGFSEYRTILGNWYQPYTVGVQWGTGRFQAEVAASAINNFRSAMFVVFRDIDAGGDDENVNLPLILPNSFDYKVELPLRYLFSPERKDDVFLEMHSVIVAPFWERVTTGQSNWHYTFTKKQDADDADATRSDRTIQQWSSVSTLLGMTIGLEFRF